MLTLRAFGALDFRDATCESLPPLLHQPKRAALLAYLILAHPERMCRRDTLLALFWPDLDDQGGRRALSQALSFLRHHLPEGILLTRGHDEVGVDPARVRSDVGAFRTALAAGAWEEALAQYQGDLLEGLHVAGAAPFTDWVDRERECLREAAAGAAWKQAHALVSAGETTEAERTAQRALQFVPTDERPVRDFIRALSEAGDRAAALHFYERFALLLAQELDVEPAPETRAVAEAVRRGEVCAVHVPDTRAGPVPSHADAPHQDPPGGSGPVEAGGPDPGPAGPARNRSRVLLAGLAGFVALAGGGIAAAYFLVGAPGGAVTPTDLRPITFEKGMSWLPALSPDGRDVAFAAGGQIVIRSVDHVPGQGEVRLGGPTTVRALSPSWTPDGSGVRFLACTESDACRWTRADRTGGNLRALDLPEGVPRDEPEMAWAPDGLRVAFFRGDTLFVASEREAARPLFAMDARDRRFGLRHSLAWSPDGSRIAFVNGSRRLHFLGWESDPASIWVVDAHRGTAREAVGGPATHWSPVWMDASRILFSSGRDGPQGIYVVEITGDHARGEPQLVLGGVDSHTLSYHPGSGRMAFARYRIDLSIRSYPRPAATLSVRDGTTLPLGNLYAQDQDVSADGAWLAFDAMFRGNTDLYKMNVTTGEVVRLTDSPEDEWGPRWSRDGREIAFTAMPGAGGPGQFEVFVIPTEGGTPVRVSHSSGPGDVHVMPTWSPDGLKITYAARPLDQGGGDAWIVARDSVGGRWGAPRRLIDKPYFLGVWDPEGTSILFQPVDLGMGPELVALSPGGTELWRRDIPATTPLRTFGRNMQIRISPEGDTLFSRGVHKDGAEGIWAIPDFGRGVPRLVVALDDPALHVSYLSVAPDRLYLTVRRESSDVWVATLRR